MAFSSFIDGLSEHVAVLDASARIVHVNRAWRRFAEANGLDPDEAATGNYLNVADASPQDPHAAAMARGIRRVIAGELLESEIEYPISSSMRT